MVGAITCAISTQWRPTSFGHRPRTSNMTLPSVPRAAGDVGWHRTQYRTPTATLLYLHAWICGRGECIHEGIRSYVHGVHMGNMSVYMGDMSVHIGNMSVYMGDMIVHMGNTSVSYTGDMSV